MVQSKNTVSKSAGSSVGGEIPPDKLPGLKRNGSKKAGKLTVTSPHSGHFMSSTLDDDEELEYDDMGSGIEAESVGYDFSTANQLPQPTYNFTSGTASSEQVSTNFDTSLSKLFDCMSIAYRGKLSTPKFKAFKGMKINVWDKMRLNNIIWREWHLQFVKKNKPLVCSFNVHMEEVLKAPQAVVLEGKYWKRQLGIICNEYQKWRVFYKKMIMPKSQERPGRSKHSSGQQISELLDRVADHSSAPYSQIQQPAADTLQLDDDLKMDFSDTLFSAFSQLSGQPSRMDYSGFMSTDFTLQPGLIGLQPTLDDLGSMDTMEPFQDLLAEALNWNTTSTPYQPSMAFGGSLNNLNMHDTKPGLNELEATLVPSYTRTDGYDSENQPQLYIPNSSNGTVLHAVTPGVTSTLHLQPQQVNIASTHQQYTMVQLSTVSQSDQSLYTPTTAFNRTTASSNHTNSSTWKTIPTLLPVNPLPQQAPVIQNQPSPQYTEVMDEFVKPKANQRKPRTIAPKIACASVSPSSVQINAAAAANNRTSSSSLAATSFLAQLLTKNQVPNSSTPQPAAALSRSAANGSGSQLRTAASAVTVTPQTVALSSKTNNQTLVPALIASSRNPTAITTPNLPAVTGQVFTIGSTQDVKSLSPSSARGDEFLAPSKHSEELQQQRREPTSAEQKRRSHIKNGFEALQTLVPALANHPTNKVSKAAMLQKTAEFAQKLKTERQQMQEEANLLQQEIDALNGAISSCQCQLPATGAPVTRQHNDQMKIMLNSYIRERTAQNWKFYLFSHMSSHLFDSFNSMVSTASIEELARTTQTWLDQHCTLPALRPAVLDSMRKVCINTSILSDPGKLPEEAQDAVLKETLIPPASTKSLSVSSAASSPGGACGSDGSGFL